MDRKQARLRRPKIAWRDSFMTWPHLSIALLFFPWEWRLRWWGEFSREDGGTLDVIILFLQIRLGWNRFPFALEHRGDGEVEWIVRDPLGIPYKVGIWLSGQYYPGTYAKAKRELRLVNRKEPGHTLDCITISAAKEAKVLL